MKAQVLTVCVPYAGCDKNCPYCVSKMTGYCQSNTDLMKRNFTKVKEFAKAAQITSVLITSKGEPLLQFRPLLDIMWEFKDFPMELQTNGIMLNQNVELLRALQAQGLDVLAVSIDHWAQVHEYRKMFEEARHIGLTTRITANLVKQVTDHSFDEWVGHCKDLVDQLSFRSITVPNNIDYRSTKVCSDAIDWIKENISTRKVETFLEDMKTELNFRFGREIRRLAYGAVLYDYKGLSITHFEYCIQDKSTDDDVRSLIFQEDGHLYTTWNSKASRLF